jgi:hypothetical protein
LKEGLLGDASNIRACRSKAGPFEPLRTYAEFRDIVMAPTTMKAAEAGVSKATPSAARSGARPAVAQAGPGSSKSLPRTGATATATPPPSSSRNPAPHIEFETSDSAMLSVLKWLLFFGLALASGLITFKLFLSH